MAQHGDKRGEIVKRVTSDQPAQWRTLDSGLVLKVTPGALTETGRERWCDTCQEWVLSLGIMDNLICRQCGTAWIGEE